MWLRSETKRAVLEAVRVHDGPDVPHRLQGGAAGVLHQDRRGGHAPGHRVLAPDLGLGGPVAGQLAARGDQVGRVALVVQLDGVVQPGGEGRPTGGRCTGRRRGRRSRPRGGGRPAGRPARSGTWCSRRAAQPPEDEGEPDQEQVPQALAPGEPRPGHRLDPARRPRSGLTRRVAEPGAPGRASGGRRGPLAAVALLVLAPGTAPALVVAAHAHARRRVAGSDGPACRRSLTRRPRRGPAGSGLGSGFAADAARAAPLDGAPPSAARSPRRAPRPPAPVAGGGRAVPSVPWRRRRLADDRDAEDRRRDLVADEGAHLLVEAEGLLLEGVERVLLGEAAQADALAHLVDLGQVLDPDRVDRAQQDEALDQRPLVGVLLRPSARASRRRGP